MNSLQHYLEAEELLQREAPEGLEFAETIAIKMQYLSAAAAHSKLAEVALQVEASMPVVPAQEIGQLSALQEGWRQVLDGS